MKLVKTRTLTRPSTDVRYTIDTSNDITALYVNIDENNISNGNIISNTISESDDQLTRTNIIIFASINDFVNYRKEVDTVDYSNSNFVDSLQYMADNNITLTQTFSFEP